MTAIRSFTNGVMSFKANADLSASNNRYLFTRLVSGSADNIQIASGASAPRPCGILQNTPCSGEEAEVCVFGPSKLRCHISTSNIGLGSFLTSDASGYGVIDQTAGCNPAAAIALEALTAGSAIIEVFMLPFGTGVVGAAS